jgi:ABC-type multidrug transport system ATPase subunit
MGDGANRAERLALVGIEKSFGSLSVLRGAELTARAGEIVGLCGDHGAGKSTLVKILAGVHAHGSFRGEVQLDGATVRLSCPADARRAGIEVVHSQSVLVPQLSVAHNLLLGDEPRRFGLVDEVRLQSRAREVLERFGFAGEVDPLMPVGELATGWRLIVEVLRALARGPRVLVLDEPAAALQPHERARWIEWLAALRRGGTTCLYVAHRIDELMGICDDITVLRDGRTARTACGAPRSMAAGRYLVHEEIASGGMASVHLGAARGPFGFATTVAIKRLHAALAKDPDFVAMFLDEARLASRVRHGSVVSVLDVIAEDGELGLVMEYVAGESLARLCRAADEQRAPVPVPVAVAIAASILHGLHAAHQARDEQGAPLGLVHRDVSPQNVLVGADGIARLIDFGIAKAAGRAAASSRAPSRTWRPSRSSAATSRRAPTSTVRRSCCGSCCPASACSTARPRAWCSAASSTMWCRPRAHCAPRCRARWMTSCCAASTGPSTGGSRRRATWRGRSRRCSGRRPPRRSPSGSRRWPRRRWRPGARRWPGSSARCATRRWCARSGRR